jgi:hypothetical protein
MTDLETATFWLGWINFAKILGAFLVAIGVAAEFVGEFAARPYEHAIEVARQAELASLTAATAEANERAYQAKSEAASAGERAALLEKEAAKLHGPYQSIDIP